MDDLLADLVGAQRVAGRDHLFSPHRGQEGLDHRGAHRHKTFFAALALLGNTVATGARLFVLIGWLGPISGARLNPAVSLVAALRGELPGDAGHQRLREIRREAGKRDAAELDLQLRIAGGDRAFGRKRAQQRGVGGLRAQRALDDETAAPCGRCDRCAGNGFEKVEMQFLSDLFVTCPDCSGKRYKTSTLGYTYEGKSIAEILDLTVVESIDFFSNSVGALPTSRKRTVQIIKLLNPLVEVGLGYLRLGQPLNTLSGGEAQRLKLCQLLSSALPEDSKQKTKKLLILDEPTTGLHFSDIENLLIVFQKLVDSGHSLLIIEHNLDVIKSADWILDLGPEAGKNGGQLVAQGSPETVAKLDTPTAHYLKQALDFSFSFSDYHPVTLNHEAFSNTISLKGARHHNLKNISVEIPRDKLVVISGLSGSGKSTLAFDILFAEGQRRFLDSMSAYARQFAEQLEKPEMDQLAGLPPTVAIEQRVSQGNGKSTVATVTELWNFIRLLYSKIGTLYCPSCDVPVAKQSLSAIENAILAHLKKGNVTLLAPVIRGKKGYHTEIAEWALKHGFKRLLVDKQFKDAEGFVRLERFKEHDIDIEIASFQGKVFTDQKKSKQGVSAPKTENFNLAVSLSKALEIGKGLIKLFTADKKFILLSTKSSCPTCNQSFEELDPRLFSFNSPHGWCVECRGHGRVPKRRQYLDTARFDSVLAAELDADRAIERMENVELIECPSCHGSRLNPTASALMGVNNSVVISFTFGLGSALAAAGGILYASLYPSVEPFMGIMPGLKAFIAAVLGGIGNIPGAALGGLIIGVTETLVGGYSSAFGLPTGYKDGVAFVILILILLFKPSGLLGKTEREKV